MTSNGEVGRCGELYGVVQFRGELDCEQAAAVVGAFGVLDGTEWEARSWRLPRRARRKRRRGWPETTDTVRKALGGELDRVVLFGAETGNYEVMLDPAKLRWMADEGDEPRDAQPLVEFLRDLVVRVPVQFAVFGGSVDLAIVEGHVIDELSLDWFRERAAWLNLLELPSKDRAALVEAGVECIDTAGEVTILRAGSHWNDADRVLRLRRQAAIVAWLRGNATVDDVVDPWLAELARRELPTGGWDPDLDPVLPAVFEELFQLHAAELARSFLGRTLPVDECVPAESLTVQLGDASDVEAWALGATGPAEVLPGVIADVAPRVAHGDVSPRTFDTLVLLDRLFYLRNLCVLFREPAARERMVEALGGFLGDTLVMRLGGRWLPRSDLDEAAVVVGTHAYQPWKRARRYLESKEAALEYSFTKFFRDAERRVAGGG